MRPTTKSGATTWPMERDAPILRRGQHARLRKFPRVPHVIATSIDRLFLECCGSQPKSTEDLVFGFGWNRPTSVASSVLSNVSSMFSVKGRKVRQLFSPVLPDELVLSLGEKVTLVKAFDDGSLTMASGILLNSSSYGVPYFYLLVFRR
jgi:hypothetical protein